LAFIHGEAMLDFFRRDKIQEALSILEQIKLEGIRSLYLLKALLAHCSGSEKSDLKDKLLAKVAIPEVPASSGVPPAAKPDFLEVKRWALGIGQDRGLAILLAHVYGSRKFSFLDNEDETKRGPVLSSLVLSKAELLDILQSFPGEMLDPRLCDFAKR